MDIAAETDVCNGFALCSYFPNFAYFIRATRFDEPVVSMNRRGGWHVNHHDHNLTVQIADDSDLFRF